MTEEEKALAGKVFNPCHSEFAAIKAMAHKLCTDYNLSYETETQKREQILEQLLGSKGNNVFFQGPIFFNHGNHTFIGDGFFGNYNICIQDDAKVTIGRHVMFGPNCTLATPYHPLIADERRYRINDSGELYGPCMASPIVIGDDVWLAANVTVCGGVTIGCGSVIGAGSVVTRDIPENVIAAGVPCRVLRKITPEDSIRLKPWLFNDNSVDVQGDNTL